ncbi:ATP-binding cassette domain-containing protein [Mycolicibacterium thermoresistibile]|jgi:phosphonate C-P lyase system protein PhnK|uniref:ABC transporter--like protein n=2 Tax=Mycolicibacterium thermoresistibile TaxID=1797 RepID=G7CBM6_MYCT3|nr:ATP-binding cassette domain-containing protein [Mycolicibacterium thermoresistibile]EHI14530.1 ABC transporter--like protein [Mycolicibacterium thermoresistibile ATCC 19527]MCV7188374.1 ATP-binding cassette domain-containing protein [Mycolicibacterium thermoresistibile]GAT17545.1 ABC transporter--like protein [Mycolicibacterium thermoresistibile]SNW18297.1 ABC transporter--like protein [Mycolicibacterium thermoresistibile]
MTVDAAPGPVPTLLPPEPVLSVRELSHRYGPGCPDCVEHTGPAAGTNRCPICGSIIAIHAATFDVGPREVLGIVGESGSGKTTLLRCLYRAGTAVSGSVRIDGEPVRRSAVVMVHQNALAAGLHLRLAAEANVAQRLLERGWRGFGAIHDRAGAMLTELGLNPERHTDPLETFSGGMQQRVQLARALVDPPRLLLLDEPTTGLDPSVQAGLLDAVQRVTGRLDSATVVVSHDLAAVRVLASRILVVYHGRIVEDGVAEQVLEDPRHPYTQLLVSSRLT